MRWPCPFANPPGAARGFADVFTRSAGCRSVRAGGGVHRLRAALRRAEDQPLRDAALCPCPLFLAGISDDRLVRVDRVEAVAEPGRVAERSRAQHRRDRQVSFRGTLAELILRDRRALGYDRPPQTLAEASHHEGPLAQPPLGRNDAICRLQVRLFDAWHADEQRAQNATDLGWRRPAGM